MEQVARKNQQIANSFYNLGLSKARVRDLSGAAESLKKSLHFNKYQTDARNLLGLIYYENGEVADALVQWVISLNLKPEDNLADYYLDEIQRKPGQLEVESQNVKTFNQALWHAQNGSDDLAILQLARVVEARPHFVKAHLLLALLYMAREDFNKAGRCLYKILQIDKSNQKALHYMSIVKQNIAFALGVKAIVLILGAIGFASMWAAVFADVGVSVIAILNAVRALQVTKDDRVGNGKAFQKTAEV